MTDSFPTESTRVARDKTTKQPVAKLLLSRPTDSQWMVWGMPGYSGLPFSCRLYLEWRCNFAKHRSNMQKFVCLNRLIRNEWFDRGMPGYSWARDFCLFVDLYIWRMGGVKFNQATKNKRTNMIRQSSILSQLIFTARDLISSLVLVNRKMKISIDLN